MLFDELANQLRALNPEYHESLQREMGRVLRNHDRRNIQCSFEQRAICAASAVLERLLFLNCVNQDYKREMAVSALLRFINTGVLGCSYETNREAAITNQAQPAMGSLIPESL